MEKSLSRFINVGLGEFIYIGGTINLKEHTLNINEYIPPHKRDENNKLFLGCFRLVEYCRDFKKNYVPLGVGTKMQSFVDSIPGDDILKYTNPIFIFHNNEGIRMFIRKLNIMDNDTYYRFKNQYKATKKLNIKSINLPENF
jgi:hypothetical protein